MMFGSCKVCAEKDKRVSALEAEITFLRDLVRPKVTPSMRRLNAGQVEADAIMSGHDQEIIIDEKSRYLEDPLPRLTAEEEEITRERDAILNGNY